MTRERWRRGILRYSVFCGFWPMIEALWATGTGEVVRGAAELHALVQRWFVWDSLRIGLMAASFLASVKALSLPCPREN